MDNNNYYNYEYESSHGYTQDASIPPFGYTPTDGTSSFNLTPPFITNKQTPTPEDTTPDTAKWYHYVESVKGRQHKDDTNNYPFDLNSENSGADECMRSLHGRPSLSSVNLGDDGSPFSQSKGLERPLGHKASKTRKHKANPYNVNLLSEDIL
ncbi:hypothetical protein QYF36_026974 [Acer negundo]|nr:hypothetical protein QYF36_026974 [Acer negundo]